MYLKELKLSNFKNISDADLEFCSKLNCIVGYNGVGKTNILDSIHYLSFCKSYFNVIDNNNIKHKEDFFAIHGFYSLNDNIQAKFSCTLKRGQKKIFKSEDKEYERFSEHIGKIPLVMITPSDHEIILGGSDLRRRFLDLVISQADILYLDNLIQYNKALEQRNKLLKHFFSTKIFDETSLSLWDEQLVKYGSQIYKRRKAFIKNFIEHFQYYYNFITSDVETVSIEYLSNDYENNFINLLLENRERDKFLNYTSVGIHKDDLGFKLNEYNIKKFASQGQQKSFLLALKLAQFEYLYKQKGVKPILLLDDVFDKLDINRVRQLILLVGSDRFGQVFLTDTQYGRVNDIFKSIDIGHKIYSITDKEIICEK